MLLILAALYFIKSFKESRCVAHRPKKHSYVQTSAPKPKYVQQPIQTQTGDYPPASHGYDSIGHTNSIQPPEYTPHPSQPSSQGQGTNYFRPFKDGMGNVPHEPRGITPKETSTKGETPDNRRKTQKTKVTVAEQKQMAERKSSSEGQKYKPERLTKSTSKDVDNGKSSPKETREKPKGSSDESSFKIIWVTKER